MSQRHGEGAAPAQEPRPSHNTSRRHHNNSVKDSAGAGWLRNAIAEKAVSVRGLNTAGMVVLTPLGRTGGRHDYTCDRCSAVVPSGLVCGTAQAQPGIHVIFGLCTPCAVIEGVQIDGAIR